MKKIVFITILTISILSGTFIADAVDLPIDIDFIGQDTGSREAHTENVNVDILTPTAREMTQAINDYNSQTREILVSKLFVDNICDEILNNHEQIIKSATSSALFAEPVDYYGIRMAYESSSISIWVIIALFGVSVIIGFVLAHTLMQRRRDIEQDVYQYHN
ncbi:MAG: hypothetical protein LBC73_06975 [Oscillospiraceae bacterium]|nr:hypothetical protein [Oscillospiraceae bacterium]